MGKLVKPRPTRTLDGSGLTECPVCCRQVPLAAINIHLDTSCLGPQRIFRKPSPSPSADQTAANHFNHKVAAGVTPANISLPTAIAATSSALTPTAPAKPPSDPQYVTDQPPPACKLELFCPAGKSIASWQMAEVFRFTAQPDDSPSCMQRNSSSEAVPSAVGPAVAGARTTLGADSAAEHAAIRDHQQQARKRLKQSTDPETVCTASPTVLPPLHLPHLHALIPRQTAGHSSLTQQQQQQHTAGAAVRPTRHCSSRADSACEKHSPYFSQSRSAAGTKASTEVPPHTSVQAVTPEQSKASAHKVPNGASPDRGPGLAANNGALSPQLSRPIKPLRTAVLQAPPEEAQQDVRVQALAQLSAGLQLVAEPHKRLNGEFLIKDFVSPGQHAEPQPAKTPPCAEEVKLVCFVRSMLSDILEEEAELIRMVDHGEPPWKDSTFNGSHRGKAWGVCMDLKTRKVGPAKVPMPDVLERLARRMNLLPPLAGFLPNEANAIDYRRGLGHHLQAHVDDRRLSTNCIATLSLLGAAVMTFKRGKPPFASVDVELPLRALQVLTRDARYSFTHAIRKQNLLAERRVSITFRQSPISSQNVTPIQDYFRR